MPADASLVSAADAARILGISERTIRRAIQRGELPAVRLGRAFAIRPHDLERYGTLAASKGRPWNAPPAAEAREPDGIPPIIGREQEIAHLLHMARHSERRVISIVGPGGVGKTRLALAIAELLGPEFADGPVFVDLASITSASDVPRAIAATAGIYPGTRPGRICTTRCCGAARR